MKEVSMLWYLEPRSSRLRCHKKKLTGSGSHFFESLSFSLCLEPAAECGRCAERFSDARPRVQQWKGHHISIKVKVTFSRCFLQQLWRDRAERFAELTNHIQLNGEKIISSITGLSLWRLHFVIFINVSVKCESLYVSFYALWQTGVASRAKPTLLW